jgi:hypothetical protein
MVNIREVIADYARGYVDCGVTLHPIEYAQLVMGPGDPESSYSYFVSPHTSGCALVVRGLWRLAGLQHERLVKPYRVGHAIDDVVSIANEYDAWVLGWRRQGKLPQMGDAVIVGAAGREHAYTVVEVETPAGCLCELTTVDGGQRDAAGNETIGLRHRTWNLDHTGMVIDRTHGESNDLGAGVSRPLAGFVDVSLLPFVVSE